MLTNIIATNKLGDVFVFDSTNRLVDGLDLSGLQADVNLIDKSTGGSYYQNTRLQTRQLSLLVHLFKPEINAVNDGIARDRAYRVFNPESSPITFTFNAYDGNSYSLTAYSTQAPLMRPDKRNDNNAYQIMLLEFVCPDPYIYRTVESRVEIASFSGGFQFDWEIPAAGYEFETRNQSLIGNVNYQGSNETGMSIRFRARSQVVNPTLINVGTLEQIRLNFTMQTGDVIIVNTERGNRSIQLIRNNVTSNIFYSYVIQGSTFLQLRQGDNFFRYQADSGEENLELVIQYRERRIGI